MAKIQHLERLGPVPPRHNIKIHGQGGSSVKTPTSKKVFESYGHSSAISGNEVIVNCGMDGVFKVTPEVNGQGNRDKSWGMYCKYLKVTVEEVTEEEALSYHNKGVELCRT